MPIAAGQTVLQNALKSAFSMGKGATQQAVVGVIISGLTSIIPMGIFPTAPTPIPLAPAGISATQSNLNNSLGLGKASTIDTTAQLISLAVSLAAPMAPPAGLSILQNNIKSAFSMGKAANIDTVTQLISVAIIQYYLAGGVM